MSKVFILKIEDINIIYVLSEQQGRYYRVGSYDSIDLIIDLLGLLGVEFHTFTTLGEGELIRMIKVFHSGFREEEIEK